MAIVLTELLDGRSSNDSGSTARRAFRCYDDAGGTVTESLARAQVTLNGLSAGHAHPFISGIVGRAPSYQQNGRFVDVTIDYVVPQLGNPQPPIDPTNPNFTSISCDYRRTEVKLPTYQRQKFKMKGPGETSVVKELWVPDENPRPFTVSNYVWTYRLSGAFVEQFTIAQWLAVWNGINARADELHEFNGILFRFEPRRISQETASTAAAGSGRGAIEYNWVYDPGIKLRDLDLLSEGATGPDGSGNNVNLRTFYKIGSPGRSGYIPVEDPDNQVILYPWREVSISANDLGPEYPPLTTFSDKFRRNPTGWASLPGVL